MKRRHFLRALAHLTALSILPVQAFAALKRKAFRETAVEAAISEVFGPGRLQDTVAIDLRIPLTVSNPLNVPVTVRTRLEGARRVALLAHEHPYPLLGVFELTPRMLPEIATRLNLLYSGEVSAVVEAQGRLYRVTRYVELLNRDIPPDENSGRA